MPSYWSDWSGNYRIALFDYDNLSTPNTDLIHSTSLNSMQDIIKAEENIMAQHEYLQKMETERFLL